MRAKTKAKYKKKLILFLIPIILLASFIYTLIKDSKFVPHKVEKEIVINNE